MQNDLKSTVKNKYSPAFSYLTSKRNQKFYGIILTLCALSFFGFFAIKPTVSTILKLQKELRDNQYILKQLETKISNLTELRKQYSKLYRDIPIVTNAIPTQPDVHLLFAQIQSIAQTSNVTIEELQSSEVEVLKNDNTAKNYYSYSFNTVCSGSFEDMSKFIKKLTNMERIINIDTFSINDNSTGTVLEQPKFSIQGSAFFKNSL
jgi:Tfp pilus assembly protein PilO